MEYSINIGIYNKIFAVPTAVVDDFLKLARGNDVKILLFLLRHSGEAISEEDIAAGCHVNEEQVAEAIDFWSQSGIITREEAKSSLPIKIAAESTTASPSPATEKSDIPTKAKKPPKFTLTPKEIAERIDSSDEVKFLFTTTEVLLSRPVNSTEQRLLIYMHDYLGLPADIIIMLLEYCKSIDKLNLGYAEKIASSWQEKDITTHDKAENEIRRMNEQHTIFSRVRSIFGIDSALTPKQRGFIQSWSDLGIDDDLIRYAYEKTMDNKGKLNFPYINAILLKWNESGFKSRADVDREDVKTAKSDSNSHSYDLDEFERLAENYTPKLEVNSDEE